MCVCFHVCVFRCICVYKRMCKRCYFCLWRIYNIGRERNHSFNIGQMCLILKEKLNMSHVVARIDVLLWFRETGKNYRWGDETWGLCRFSQGRFLRPQSLGFLWAPPAGLPSSPDRWHPVARWGRSESVPTWQTLQRWLFFSSPAVSEGDLFADLTDPGGMRRDPPTQQRGSSGHHQAQPLLGPSCKDALAKIGTWKAWAFQRRDQTVCAWTLREPTERTTLNWQPVRGHHLSMGKETDDGFIIHRHLFWQHPPRGLCFEVMTAPHWLFFPLHKTRTIWSIGLGEPFYPSSINPCGVFSTLNMVDCCWVKITLEIVFWSILRCCKCRVGLVRMPLSIWCLHFHALIPGSSASIFRANPLNMESHEGLRSWHFIYPDTSSHFPSWGKKGLWETWLSFPLLRTVDLGTGTLSGLSRIFIPSCILLPQHVESLY